jgi:lipid-binding SYLF domain-containing protein
VDGVDGWSRQRGSYAFTMRTHHVLSVLAVLLAASASRVQADTDDVAKAVKEADDTLALMKRTDATLPAFMERSVGYAVFPSVGKGAVGVGGAHGSGVLFDHAGKPLGKASLSQVTVGLALGGQTFSQVIFFETAKAMSDFMSGDFAFAAQASAVAVKSGAAAHAKYQNGVAIFTATKGGLMYEASVGGQKFKFTPFNPQMPH